MKHLSKAIILPVALLLLLVTSCKDKNAIAVAESRFAHNYPEFDSQFFHNYIKEHLTNDSILSPLYEVNEYTAIWTKDTLNTDALYEFIKILEAADEHGLKADQFSASEIKAIATALDSGAYKNNTDSLYTQLLALEKLSARSILKYAAGMSYGFTDPKILFGKDYDIVVSKPDSIFYNTLYQEISQNPVEVLSKYQPSAAIYAKLQDAYREIKRLEEDSVHLGKITSGDATYKLGDSNKHITEIAERLMATGEYKADSATADSLHRELNEELLAAINAFRKKNSYLEDKEVGKPTIDALNRPFKYYKNKLAANMERYRWKRAKAKHNKHIEVNVASFMLEATRADSLPLTMRVCVGKPENKTPLLGSDINYINLNPTWNIPKSIAQNEVAVLQKRDQNYMKKRNMRIFKGGKEVHLDSVDWKSINPTKFSYIIRQDPGYGNSLGLIKFMFNNNHSVYLHDTPSKSAFNRKVRAVSHGCVRVQKPFDLGVFCIAPASSKHFRDQLLFSVKREPETKEGKKMAREGRLKKLPDIINISADDKISLFIDYYTAFMYTGDKELYYADDIYGYDSIILKALSAI
ncbi:murein L,D-transpeptidase [Dysgonomonas sp. 511]|uniref:L,D-transpeptidase family protein n=1 Tax=Dysgonomonas sp. 511 TaxID=2302930 RepID=UPI0013D7749C|nr:L,D-transpeptidase family protein [Dysgonomonas sp. 511]NDV77675.1 L,D-transpeptidase [Dysgonomonas sp. 511]